MATNNNRLTLHRKEWQMMSPALAATADGHFITKDPLGERRTAMLVSSTGSPALYDTEEDAWELIPSLALGGTFGAGACGTWSLWSLTVTATGGSTTTATYTGRYSDRLVGRTIKFMSGSNNMLRRTIVSVAKIVGGTNDTNTITFDSALPSSVVNGDTFQLDSGRYWVKNAGTSSASTWKSYCMFTGIVTNHSVTNLPASWATDGKVLATPSYVGAYATGTATSATSTTISNSAKTWTANQWTNYVVRITAGTGIGQVRYISSNTGTQITVSAAWTTTPDTTSEYAIEANDDYIYLLGNAAVTMYRYNITLDTWTVLSPTTARVTAPSTGMSANWLSKTNNAKWADESNIQDGRYIYSFRGGATADLHRYDIALNTWETISYLRQLETFTTGSMYDFDNGRIYIQQNNLGKFFYYDVCGNQIIPWNFDFYPQSTARMGDRMFTVAHYDGSGDVITWVYYVGSAVSVLRRCMVFDKG